MSTTHSLGPWQFSPADPNDICLIGEVRQIDRHGPLVALLYNDEDTADPEGDERNARLMAAAPALLSALQQIAWLADAEQPLCVRAAAIAREAIAKATSEGPQP